MNRKQLHQDVYIGIVCILITVIAFILNKDIFADAAFMPRLLCGMMGILGALITAEGVKKTNEAAARGEVPKKYLDLDTVRIPFITWLLVLGYVIFFHLAGYFVSTALALVIFMRFMKRKSWSGICMIIVVYLATMYFAFVMKMHVPVNNLGMLGKLF